MIKNGFLAGLALLVASPAVAQDSPPEKSDFRQMSDEDLRGQFQNFINRGFRNPCGLEAPLLEEMRRRRDSVELERGHLLAQIYCAAEHDDAATGTKLMKRLERMGPAPILGPVALYFALVLNDGPEAMKRLRQVESAGGLQTISREHLGTAMRVVRRGGGEVELDEFLYGVATKSTFARYGSENQAMIAFSAIRHAARVKDTSRIEDLLQYYDDPNGLLEILADRTFEPAWPLVEQHVGENLVKVSDAHVKSTAENLAEKPEDRDRLSAYSYALLFAGRFQEAADLAQGWLPADGSLKNLPEGNAWALNIEAYALDALGRPGEADKVFDDLATLPADQYPWVVNFVINRASRLVGYGRWEEGLVATDLARSAAEKYGTTYAKLLIARDRTCALHNLGRTAEAEVEAKFLVENFDESAPVAASGLLCLGRKDEVEQRIARAFKDPIARLGFVDELQDERFSLFYTPSVLPDAREVVLANDDLRETALRYVRLLPDSLVPIAYLRRQELAQAHGSPGG
ncbi:MAG: hypothetical protein J7493_15965 [Porphyrobacter sp.]|nr:hypothetical protein [Porphyrobacter sp.]